MDGLDAVVTENVFFNVDGTLTGANQCCIARLPCCEAIVSVEFATDFAHNWRQNGKELTRHWGASERLIVQQYIQK